MSFEFLNETLNEAGKELLSRFGGKIDVMTKGDSSFLTEADLASEKIVISRIQKYFPDDLILSEEAGFSSTVRTPGKRIWIIDPLDGTTNFSNGYPFFCVSIGCGVFLANGQVDMEWGGIIDPCGKKTFLAGKGKGAFLNDKPMRVSQGRPLEKSFLVTGFYYSMGEKLNDEISKFAKVASQCQSIRRDGAAALDLALVAAGVFDAFWERGLQPWDVAAGSLLVSEAGGEVTNYATPPESGYNVEGDGIVAGNPHIAQTLRKLFW